MREGRNVWEGFQVLKINYTGRQIVPEPGCDSVDV